MFACCVFEEEAVVLQLPAPGVVLTGQGEEPLHVELPWPHEVSGREQWCEEHSYLRTPFGAKVEKTYYP